MKKYISEDEEVQDNRLYDEKEIDIGRVIQNLVRSVTTGFYRHKAAPVHAWESISEIQLQQKTLLIVELLIQSKI